MATAVRGRWSVYVYITRILSSPWRGLVYPHRFLLSVPQLCSSSLHRFLHFREVHVVVARDECLNAVVEVDQEVLEAVFPARQMLLSRIRAAPVSNMDLFAGSRSQNLRLQREI